MLVTRIAIKLESFQYRLLTACLGYQVAYVEVLTARVFLTCTTKQPAGSYCTFNIRYQLLWIRFGSLPMYQHFGRF